VETSLGEFHHGIAGQEQSQNAEDMADTVKQIEQERSALDSSRKLLEELLSKAKEEAIVRAVSESQNRSTHITFGNQGKGFQIGINNGPISGINF
jgi:DNA-binding transcriptional regulator GbsR (MarR family)